MAPVYGQQGQIGTGQIPVYFAGKDVDITQEIVKRYDSSNPVAAEAAPAGGAQPPTRTATTPKPPAKPPAK